MRRIEIVIVLAVLAVALGVRVAALSSDPPGWLSWSAGIYSDEGIYSADARLWVLYQQRMPGDFRVSIIAPLQNEVCKIVFERLGVSLRSLRLISVAAGMGVLATFWLAMRLRYGPRTAMAALGLLAISAPFVLYNRLGLMESPALFWLSLAYAFLAYAEQSRGGVRSAVIPVLCGGAAALAVAWKGTFILGAAPLLLYALIRLRSRGLIAVGSFCGSIARYAAVFVLPHRRTFARVGSYYLQRQYLPHTIAGVVHNLIRGVATGQADGVLPYLVRFAPIVTLLAVGALAAPMLRSRADLWLWLWLLIPIAAFLVLDYTPSRYFLIFWPALVGLAACAAARLSRTRAVGVAAAALAMAAAWNGFLLVSSYRNRTYTEQNDARILQSVMPHDAWLAGQFAPELCLGNSLRAVYVQPGLANSEPNVLSVLPITHVLATVTASRRDDPWAGHYRRLIFAPAGLETLPVGRRFTVRVYANLDALP